MDISQEEFEKVERGELAKRFLETDYWQKLVKPALEGAVEFLDSVRSLKSADLSSEAKASVEIKARKLALETVESVRSLIESGYELDAGYAQERINKKKSSKNLYNVKENS